MPRQILEVANRLLAGLPPACSTRLQPDLVRVSLAAGEVADAPDAAVRDVYFPTTAVLSMRCTMHNGKTVEAAMVGNDGMTGLATCLGMDTAPSLAVVEIAGNALRIRAPKLKVEFARGEALRDLLLRYVHFLLAETSQSVGCNRYHRLDARVSRCLLNVRDRVSSDDFALEHESLASMVGAHRSMVSVAAGRLKAAGLIHYVRGAIRILDREGLEARACECYGAVQAAYERARLG